MKRKGFLLGLLLSLCVSLCKAQSPPDTICVFGQPSNIAVPYQSGYTYKWSVGGGQIISDQDSNDIQVDWSFALPGLHKIKCVAFNQATGCPGDTSYSSLLIATPARAKIRGPNYVCKGERVELKADMDMPHVWLDGSRDTATSFVVTKDTSVAVVALNAGCGNDTAYKRIRVRTIPEARIQHIPDTVQMGEEITFNYPNASQIKNFRIDWFFEGLYEASGSTVSYVFTRKGEANIAQVVLNDFCSDTLFATTYVEDEYTYFTPDAFSPNDDGLNDTWNPVGVGHSEYKVEIFNRWGERVYFWSQMSDEQYWDGKIDGEPAPQGSYLFRVEIKDEAGRMHYEQGHFTLIR